MTSVHPGRDGPRVPAPREPLEGGRPPADPRHTRRAVERGPERGPDDRARRGPVDDETRGLPARRAVAPPIPARSAAPPPAGPRHQVGPDQTPTMRIPRVWVDEATTVLPPVRRRARPRPGGPGSLAPPTRIERAPGPARPTTADGIVALTTYSPPTPVEVPAPDLDDELRSLSDGIVIEARPSGPLFDRARNVRRRFSRGTFVPALGAPSRILLGLLTAGWAASLVWFWVWWLEPAHRVGWFGLIVNSTILAYLSLMPAYFVFGANRLKVVDPRIPVPKLRTAFVVTRAPSEPWAVAQRTLEAMLDQDFPHVYDVWLCDESPTDEINAWCSAHRVRVSTRFEVDGYHRTSWPRRTKCKEGNLAYFYDLGGYRSYDVVAQLDCDHVPARDYLTEMVRPFADGAIGYVAAPSVCDANGAESWSARGRLHKEATFHGPNQLGHSAGLGPVCIGSHYAVRTRAVRDIGGIGPELAEDFSTSFLINSAGWHGAFAIKAEATGDGPATFAAMLVQEFQWSRSLTTVLLELVPRHLGRLPWKLRLRFLYSLAYYPLLAVTTIVGLALSPVAAVTDQPWINVPYGQFLIRWALVSIWLIAIVLLLRGHKLLRPVKAPVFSWENALYTLTRWPLNVWGVCAAVMQKIRPRPITFKVTPKGAGGLERFPIRLTMPYVVLSVLLTGSTLYAEWATRAVGYAFLCLLGGLGYAVVTVAVPMLHAREAGRAAGAGTLRSLRLTAGPASLVGLGCLGLAGFAAARFPAYLTSVFDPDTLLRVLGF